MHVQIEVGPGATPCSSSPFEFGESKDSARAAAGLHGRGSQ